MHPLLRELVLHAAHMPAAVLEAAGCVLVGAAGRLRDSVKAHELIHDHLAHLNLHPVTFHWCRRAGAAEFTARPPPITNSLFGCSPCIRARQGSQYKSLRGRYAATGHG